MFSFCGYFQVLGSPQQPCKLLEVLDVPTLSRQRSRVRVSSSPPFPQRTRLAFPMQERGVQPAYHQFSSARPRVDYRNRKILKMRCVSCGELRVGSKHDAGNHRVAQFVWTSLLMTHSHQIPSLLRGGRVKRSDSILDLLNKDSRSPPNGRHQRGDRLRKLTLTVGRW